MTHYIHNLNPVIFSLGNLAVTWYGLLYNISFIIGYFFVKKNFQKKNIAMDSGDYETLIFNIILGVLIGGRLGYVIFYHPGYYLQNPLAVLYIWEGGMSFHGGALGVILAGIMFCKKYKYDFYTLADPVMPFVAIGLGLGRIANFINGELYGKASNLPWAVVFPATDPQAIPRHPTQLYEALLEGFLMAMVLQFLLLKTKLKGLIFWLFIGAYGVVRFLIEYIRIPDDLPMYEKGLIFSLFTMGQILSLVMIISSVVFITLIYNRRTQD